MNKNTLFVLLGLGVGYYFLTTRQPVFQQMADGTYQPATPIDRLTMMFTGIQPPAVGQRSISLNIPGIIQATYNPTGASSIVTGGG